MYKIIEDRQFAVVVGGDQLKRILRESSVSQIIQDQFIKLT